MPQDVLNALQEAAKAESLCFELGQRSDSSFYAMLDVADYPEPNCKYAMQIAFDWDIPEPGRLLCYASVGIWNPPAPEEGFNPTPFIDITSTGEKEYHQMILRHLMIPAEIANIAKANADRFMEGVFERLKALSVTYSQSDFNDPKTPNALLPKAFSGLIDGKGVRLQWDEWIESQKEEL